MTAVEIYSERVDDVPVLIEHQIRMGIPAIVDAIIEPHGNRQGLSVGWLTTLWLSYMLSQGDHRLSAVEGWAVERRETLAALIPQPVGAKDCSDDRLADVLRMLSDDTAWAQIEAQLGQRLVRVYDLPRGPIRLDSTTVTVYHDTEGTTLFRHGHSKDHRPDLPQFKVMLGAIDPLGLPLATVVVPGNVADDGLYVPTLRRARQVVGRGGRLYIGDGKMGALATRAVVHAGDDYYLTPLPQTADTTRLLETLLAPVWAKEQPVERVTLPRADDVVADAPARPRPLTALGYAATRAQEAVVDGQAITWDERVLVVYSPALAKAARQGLAQRLDRAERAVRALTPPRGRGRRAWADQAALRAAVREIEARYRVAGLLDVAYEEEVTTRMRRKYGARPAQEQTQVRHTVRVARNDAAIGTVRRLLGWRLYGTNAPATALPLATAVVAYRQAPRIERNFHRLKGRPLGLRPLYLQREDHTIGLTRLLSLAVRVLTLIEYVARAALQATDSALTGLYAGNPTRATPRPTTERLLAAFQGLTLTIVALPGQILRHITPLSDRQRRIVALLGLPPSLYDRLACPIPSIPP